MWGKTLDSAVIEKGLKELCPDLHFDVATKRGAWHPRQKTRQGVFFNETHICSMDRGLVPEFKQWGVVEKEAEVGWDEADKEGVTMKIRVIKPWEPEHLDASLRLMAKEVGYEMRPDGAIIKSWPVKIGKGQGRVELVGWRHTFERIINRNLPGLTRSAIAAKFGVDMLKFPIGAPHELHAALIEE